MNRMALVPLGALFTLCLVTGCGDSASATSGDPVTSSTPDVAEITKSRIPKIRLEGAALQDSARYVSVEQVEASGAVEWVVWNPYTESNQEFGGVRFRDFVAFHAPSAKQVRLTAVDDYQVTLTADEWRDHDILLATRVDGKNMTVAEKGPVRIVVRHESGDTAAIAELKPKWIWQITEVVFE